MVSTTRRDIEGIENIDLEASSRKPWRLFRESLTHARADLLDIFRCGAVSTPTRRSHDLAPDQMQCPLCKQTVLASMRHFVVECPHFKQSRKLMQSQFRIKPEWWNSLPRVTSKSGWITFEAAATIERRSALQVAVCTVGLAVLEESGHMLSESAWTR